MLSEEGQDPFVLLRERDLRERDGGEGLTISVFRIGGMTLTRPAYPPLSSRDNIADEVSLRELGFVAFLALAAAGVTAALHKHRNKESTAKSQAMPPAKGQPESQSASETPFPLGQGLPTERPSSWPPIPRNAPVQLTPMQEARKPPAAQPEPVETTAYLEAMEPEPYREPPQTFSAQFGERIATVQPTAEQLGRLIADIVAAGYRPWDEDETIVVPAENDYPALTSSIMDRACWSWARLGCYQLDTNSAAAFQKALEGTRKSMVKIWRSGLSWVLIVQAAELVVLLTQLVETSRLTQDEATALVLPTLRWLGHDKAIAFRSSPQKADERDPVTEMLNSTLRDNIAAQKEISRWLVGHPRGSAANVGGYIWKV